MKRLTPSARDQSLGHGTLLGRATLGVRVPVTGWSASMSEIGSQGKNVPLSLEPGPVRGACGLHLGSGPASSGRLVNLPETSMYAPRAHPQRTAGHALVLHNLFHDDWVAPKELHLLLKPNDVFLECTNVAAPLVVGRHLVTARTQLISG